MKRLALLILVFSTFSGSFAQKLSYDGELNVVADNREYFSPVQNPQTIFGLQPAFKIGWSLDSNSTVFGGAVGFYEFGSSNFGKFWQPTLYYQGKSKNVLFHAGAFPRKNISSHYPIALLYDTINYYRPNIEGLALSYDDKNAFLNLWLDWTSRQTFSSRENFMLGMDAKIKLFGPVFVQGFSKLFHFAGPMDPLDSIPLNDNAAIVAQIGLDLTPYTSLDSLVLTFGLLESYDRKRGLHDWIVGSGALTTAYGKFKKFDLGLNIYQGDKQIVFHGDKFYNSDKLYARVDAGWAFAQRKNLEIKFIASFHQTEEELNSQQVLRVCAKF
ncbi:MAG: hypothetical protein ACJAZ3_001616 [Sphingobacteriales bacterium]|jgi:hypothetical protein